MFGVHTHFPDDSTAMNNTIRITTHDGRRFETRPDPSMTMSQAVFLSGAWPLMPLCSGLGKCGLCAAKWISTPPAARDTETRRFSEAELAEGWRLTCQHPAKAADIALPEPPTRRVKAPVYTDAKAEGLSLAVDLGTTSIHWAARSEAGPVGSGSDLNPQMGFGSEVISRMAAAQAGHGPKLRSLILDRLKEIAAGLPARPEAMAVAGNSAMTLLLLGLPVDGLAAAPYRLDYAGGEVVHLDPDLPPAYLPPLLAPFVGGDVSAGLAALILGDDPPKFPFMLADLGTNGEFALALSESEYILTSVPMGPALEGVGLSQGKLAEPGAVISFDPSPTGLVPSHLERPPFGGERPGISGTGYLSLLNTLFSGGLMDESGLFTKPPTPLAARLGRPVSYQGEPALQVTARLVLPASDVEETLKVKAAFNLAFSELLDAGGLKASDLTGLHLAGAMGEHVAVRDLEGLGFIPPGLGVRTFSEGNTSLAGAALLVRDQEARDWASGLSAACRVLDLTGSSSFNARFVQRMTFTHVS